MKRSALALLLALAMLLIPALAASPDTSDVPDDAFSVTSTDLEDTSSTPETTPSTPSFSDVPTTHWGYAVVTQAALDGAVKGVGEGRFEPDRTLTLGEFLTIMTRAFYPAELAKIEKTLASQGLDTPWYAAPCILAFDKGLALNCTLATDLQESVAVLRGGYSDRATASSASTLPVPRKDMGAILGRILLDLGVPHPGDFPLQNITLQNPSIEQAHGAAEMVALCYYYKILTGVDDTGNFGAERTMTRASAAAVYCRMKAAIHP